VWFIIIIIFVYFLPSKKSLCALVRGGYFLYIQFLIHIIIYILLLLLFSLFNCNQRHYGVKAKNKSVCVCHLLSFFLWLIIRSENSHDVVDEDIDKCRRPPSPTCCKRFIRLVKPNVLPSKKERKGRRWFLDTHREMDVMIHLDFFFFFKPSSFCVFLVE
jgi:hypothetical protein